MEEQIRNVLKQHARLEVSIGSLSQTDNLYNAGMTSLAVVSLMLALEEEFDVEIPNNMLGRKTFQSIDSLMNMIQTLKKESA